MTVALHKRLEPDILLILAAANFNVNEIAEHLGDVTYRGGVVARGELRQAVRMALVRLRDGGMVEKMRAKQGRPGHVASPWRLTGRGQIIARALLAAETAKDMAEFVNPKTSEMVG